MSLSEHKKERISSMLTASKGQKTRQERFWDRSIMFTRGDQWYTYDRQGSIQRASRGEGDRITRYTANLLLNLYRSLLARLTLAYPSIAVLPASGSIEDIIKGKTSEEAIQYYWQEQRLKRTIEVLIQWLLQTGSGFTHTFYNRDTDKVETATISPYDGFFEEGSSCPEDSAWVAVRSFPTREDVMRKFGHDPCFPDNHDIIMEANTSASGDKRRSADTRLNEIPANRLELFIIYWRTGEQVVWLGGRVIWEPSEEKMEASERSVREFFPITFTRYTEIPGLLWGIGLIEPLQDLQVLYNKARTQVLANVELMSNPKTLVARSANVSTKRFTNRPGEVIRWSGIGPEPRQLVPAPIPGYVLDHVARIQAEIGDAAGIHSTSLGKRAVGISSGKAIEAITARDVGHLEVTQRAIERTFVEVAGRALHLMRLHYTEARMIRMMDSQGEVVFKELRGTSLSRDPDIFIEAGSLFRDEAQDRDQKLLELLQLGIIDQPTFKEEISFRTSNGFVSRRIANMSHAQDMLEAMQRGHEIEIFYTDDLDAFFRVFDAFVKSGEFYRLDPVTQTNLRNMLVAIIIARTTPPPDPSALTKPIQPPGTPGAPGLLPGPTDQLNGPGQPTTQALAIEQNESRVAQGAEANLAAGVR